MAGHGPVGGLGGPLADHHHVAKLAGVCAATPRAALGPPGPQTAGQLPAQLAAALHLQGLVDGSVAHPHHGMASKLDPQPSRDLHRRPPLGRPAADPLGQRPMCQLRGLGPPGLLAGRVGGPATPGSGLGRRWRRPPATPWRSPSQPGGDRGEGSGMHPKVISSRSAGVSRPGPGTQRSWRTSRRGRCRAISATLGVSSPPEAPSHAATGPWP